MASRTATPTLWLSQVPDADALLVSNPLALLIGMVLDQQIPLEKAFTSPLVLQERLGRPLDAADIAALDPELLGSMFATPPALHRFPGSMAGRVQALCQAIVDEYGGDPAAIWASAPDGTALLKRVRRCPGSARRRRGSSWRCWASSWASRRPVGARPQARTASRASLLSVADIRDKATLESVRAYKKQAKAAAKAAKSSADEG